MTDREPTKVAKVKADLLIPIGEIEQAQEPSCFGKLWDMSENSCNQCADRDTCGIIFQRKLDEEAKELERKTGARFLDETCFKLVTEQSIKSNMANGDPISRLIEITKHLSRCDDMPSITSFLKRFISGNEFITTKDGRVWLK